MEVLLLLPAKANIFFIGNKDIENKKTIPKDGCIYKIIKG